MQQLQIGKVYRKVAFSPPFTQHITNIGAVVLVTGISHAGGSFLCKLLYHPDKNPAVVYKYGYGYSTNEYDTYEELSEEEAAIYQLGKEE